jgi:hypothetical protein
LQVLFDRLWELRILDDVVTLLSRHSFKIMAAHSPHQSDASGGVCILVPISEGLGSGMMGTVGER